MFWFCYKEPNRNNISTLVKEIFRTRKEKKKKLLHKIDLKICSFIEYISKKFDLISLKLLVKIFYLPLYFTGLLSAFPKKIHTLQFLNSIKIQKKTNKKKQMKKLGRYEVIYAEYPVKS